MNEIEIAQEMAKGNIPSPEPCGKFVLWCMRVSGTGFAERPAHNETTFRDPDVWLTPEMLSRCRGLPVIWAHPKGALDSGEFARRVIGNTCYTYRAYSDGRQSDSGDELWCVSRIYDDGANTELAENRLSTSPAVMFRNSDGNQSVQLDDGSRLLAEGSPSLLDHLALLPPGENGVWDRNGGPTGVRYNSTKEIPMSETAAAAMPMNGKEPMPRPDESGLESTPEGVQPDKLLTAMSDIVGKLDAMCGRLDALENKGPKKADGMPTPMLPPVAQADNVSARQEKDRTEEAAKADAQQRADSVAQNFGEHAPKPMSGESVIAYRARLAGRFQRHCAEFKGIDLNAIRNDSVFDGIETRIYADALEASKRGPDNVPFGTFREIARTDPYSGVRTVDFYGPQTIFETLAGRSQCVTGFKTPQSHAA